MMNDGPRVDPQHIDCRSGQGQEDRRHMEAHVDRGRRALPTIALLLALASLAYAGYLHFTLSSRLATAADTALRQREKQLVSQLYPSLRLVYKDLGQGVPEEPETLDQLFGPFFQIVENVGK
jgi:hypothetical protein